MHNVGSSGPPFPRTLKAGSSPGHAARSADILVVMDGVFWAGAGVLWHALAAASGLAASGPWCGSSFGGILSSRDGAGASHPLVMAPEHLRLVVEATYAAIKLIMRKEAKLAVACVSAFRSENLDPIEEELSLIRKELAMYTTSLGLAPLKL